MNRVRSGILGAFLGALLLLAGCKSSSTNPVFPSVREPVRTPPPALGGGGNQSELPTVGDDDGVVQPGRTP